jgi:A/G-specific adenine glycosylase
MMPTRYVRGVEELLLLWVAEHGRDLPWRRTRDPYAILVSEVMSQQYGIEAWLSLLCRPMPGIESASAAGPAE